MKFWQRSFGLRPPATSVFGVQVLFLIWPGGPVSLFLSSLILQIPDQSPESLLWSERTVSIVTGPRLYHTGVPCMGSRQLPDLDARVALVLARERGVVERREEAGGMPSPAWLLEAFAPGWLVFFPQFQGPNLVELPILHLWEKLGQASKGCSQNLQAKGRLLTSVQNGVRSQARPGDPFFGIAFHPVSGTQDTHWQGGGLSQGPGLWGGRGDSSGKGGSGIGKGWRFPDTPALKGCTHTSSTCLLSPNCFL